MALFENTKILQFWAVVVPPSLCVSSDVALTPQQCHWCQGNVAEISIVLTSLRCYTSIASKYKVSNVHIDLASDVGRQDQGWFNTLSFINCITLCKALITESLAIGTDPVDVRWIALGGRGIQKYRIAPLLVFPYSCPLFQNIKGQRNRQAGELGGLPLAGCGRWEPL